MERPFDVDLLDENDPFEITDQLPHLFKHGMLGVSDIVEVWQNRPLFYPARPPAHWIMVAEVNGDVLAVPLAPSKSGASTRCRPIGCDETPRYLTAQYMEDR